jgi:hypothetical protein
VLKFSINPISNPNPIIIQNWDNLCQKCDGSETSVRSYIIILNNGMPAGQDGRQLSKYKPQSKGNDSKAGSHDPEQPREGDGQVRCHHERMMARMDFS